MTTFDKLAALMFAATYFREVIEATYEPGDLKRLAKVHLGITDLMARLNDPEASR